MSKEFEYLKNLLVQKEKLIQTPDEKKKVETLKSIMANDNVFFELPMDTAVGIFEFLGVSRDNMLDLYYKLISPEAYQKLPNDYITISKEK